MNKDKKYKIILADPPWRYWEGGLKNQSQHYNTMTMEDIKALPIKDVADDDCVLFLWVTFPILKESFEVIESWGFEYSTVAFTWIKTNDNGTPFFGCGGWTRANAEICLLAKKGKISRESANVSQVILARRKEHSSKPHEVYARIEKLMGDLPRIELFARHRRQGWDNWGNQVPKEQQNMLIHESEDM